MFLSSSGLAKKDSFAHLLKMRKLSIIIITCLITSTTLAQKRSIGKEIKTDLWNGGTTIIKTYARPFHWQKKQWLQFGGVLALAGAASFLDEPINDFWQANQSRTLSRISTVGDFMGQPENNYPVMIATWATGILVNSPKIRDTGIMIFASVTTSGLLQTGLKELVGRARPAADQGAYEFRPLSGGEYHSFPSGHTMLALATSWILAKQFEPLSLKLLFYSVPVVVGFSRVYDGAHWFSDIILGSALGIACAEAVHKIYTDLKENEKESRISVLPAGRGVRLAYRF